MRKILKAVSSLLTVVTAVSFVAGCSKKTETVSVPETEKATFANAVDSSGKEIMLVENGKSDYTIVIPEMKTVYEDYASKEVQRFISQSTGVTLPITYDTGVEANTSGAYISIGNTVLFDGEMSDTE